MREAEALRAAYDGVTAAITPLSPLELLAPTRCLGWTVADVVHHLTEDARRALVALATPADDLPTRTFVTYWSARSPAAPDWESAERAAAASAWAGRRAASVAREPGLLVELWRETSAAAVQAASTVPHPAVTTQGYVLAVPDLLTTLATEAVLHHLDLLLGLPPAPEPAVSTLDGLLSLASGVRPAHWDIEDYLLKGAGRTALTPADRTALGPAAGAFPLLG
ncbi:maleylpyruvate isomerase N-terminal domain-containing protein [Catenuloplanes japonicus]|uniref:maleylpyruvate isomerase N-terminal domain-containing protein n=1 Tax=Catenuloplanes japonicus TaxID=33876 RepID=UPI000527DF6B|nr:maleylpyruvate isomerase N-terminal domain-containing protein [Catenuloplanes japonicus]